MWSHFSNGEIVRWHADGEGYPYAKQRGRVVERYFRHTVDRRLVAEAAVSFDGTAFRSVRRDADLLMLTDLTSGDRYFFDLRADGWFYVWDTRHGERAVIFLARAAKVEPRRREGIALGLPR